MPDIKNTTLNMNSIYSHKSHIQHHLQLVHLFLLLVLLHLGSLSTIYCMPLHSSTYLGPTSAEFQLLNLLKIMHRFDFYPANSKCIEDRFTLSLFPISWHGLMMLRYHILLFIVCFDFIVRFNRCLVQGLGNLWFVLSCEIDVLALLHELLVVVLQSRHRLVNCGYSLLFLTRATVVTPISVMITYLRSISFQI